MQDIETLGILTIHFNTKELKEADSPENSKTNMSQEIGTMEEYYTNTDNVLKYENEDMPNSH